MLKGGSTGAAIVPGKTNEGTLLKALHYTDADKEMPPKGKLPDAVIKDFEKWIADGAIDPRGDSALKAIEHRHREGPSVLVVRSAEGTGHSETEYSVLEYSAVPSTASSRPSGRSAG